MALTLSWLNRSRHLYFRDHAARQQNIRSGFWPVLAAWDMNFMFPGISLPDLKNRIPFRVELHVQNTGVHLFYYNWKSAWRAGPFATSGFDLGILPGASTNCCRFPGPLQIVYGLELSKTDHNLQPGTYSLLMRVVNPLPNGKMLKFANVTQDHDLNGWITLGSFNVK